MRKHLFVALSVGTAGLLALSACSGGSSGSGGSPAASASGSGSAKVGKIGVILPDTASSPRWENQDRPAFEAAFKAAGVEGEVQNADGDETKFQSIADQFINQGVSALIITSLNDGSGAAVVKKATDRGIPVVDYDRLTLGAGASYYVSYDNVSVGTAMGEGLVSCMQKNGDKSGAVIELDGAPTDNNATLFKQGYDKVIKDAGYTVAAEQAVDGWELNAAARDFQQLDQKTKGKYVGVAAANDTLGGAVISRLKSNGTAGKIPVTGQDASDEGLQRVLQGTQCLTIFKSSTKEAEAAAKIAIALAQGDKSAADALATSTSKDTKLGKDVPSVLLQVEKITPDNVQDVVDAGVTTSAKICTTADLKKLCTKYGVK